MDNRDEKWLLEEGAALALVEALNLRDGTSFEIAEHTDRPDVILEDQRTKDRIGVEVTHLFYDADEARMIFGRSHSTQHSPEYVEEYVRRLNSILAQKAEKARGYNHRYPLGLLVRVVSQVFHSYDFKVYQLKIVVPPSDFQFIWLLFYDFYHHRWTDLQQLR